MTDNRDRVITDPGLGPTAPPEPATLRSIPAAVHAASLSPTVPVYHEPALLVPVSDHRTLELETVKLSDDIDPRKFVTEPRLGKRPSVLAPDSVRPPQIALCSSQPPVGPARRRWHMPAVLLTLLGALLLWLLARAATWRSEATAEPAVTGQVATGHLPGGSAARATAAPGEVAVDRVACPGTAARATAAPIMAAAPLAPGIMAVVAPPIANSALVGPSAAPSASNKPKAHPPVHVDARPAPTHSAKSAPQPSVPLVVPSSSKPKRAIY